MQLRPYQSAALTATYHYFQTQEGNPIISVPTGGGKSLLIAEFIRTAIHNHPPCRILLLSHVKELLRQNRDELLAIWPQAPVGLYSAGLNTRQAHRQITVAGVQSIYKKGGLFNWIDIVIVDECFTGDTMITTNKGEKRIDKVRCGDIVHTATGLAEVVAKSVKTAQTIYKVRLNDGREIRCTGNHPFLSDTGWAEAKTLERGSRVYRIQDMSKLWKTLSTDSNRKIHPVKDVFRKKSLLLDILFKETRERHVVARNSRQNVSNIKKDWAQTVSSWWERQGIDGAAKNAHGDHERGMESRASYQDGSPPWNGVSDLLQSGFGQFDAKESGRAGRAFPQRQAQITGRKERQLSGDIRVESVEIEECGSNPLVYNLQTNGHPSYFANGILVHNCHLISPKANTMYQQLFNQLKAVNPSLRVLGLSATPFRTGTGHLVGQGSVFTDVCFDISLKSLIKDGYLAPLTSKGAGVQIDTKGVKITAGEFNSRQLAERADKEELTKAVITDILMRTQDRKSFLVFCSSVAHAQHVAEEFRSRGISAGAVTGAMPKDQREELLILFKTGRLQVITNFGVLTTGFNNPKVDCIILLRPTKSTSLYVQMLGRGTRTSLGKENCLVLDYSGNLERHGPVDRIEVVSKISNGKNTSEIFVMPTKVCPVCFEAVHARSLQCLCGYEFPAESNIKHERKASSANVLSKDPEWYEVKKVTYHKHSKLGKPDMIKAIYYCNLNRFTEYFCLFHGGYAQQKAEEKWKFMSDTNEIPNTIENALAQGPFLKSPRRILVDADAKYPEIKRYEF